MILVLGIIMLGAMVPTRCHRIDAYSWYSTIGELRNLTSEDLSTLQLLFRKDITAKYQITNLLLETANLRRVGKQMLERHDKERVLFTSATFFERYQKQWKRLKELSNFVFSTDVLTEIRQKMEKFPQVDDMHSVLKALLGLQKSYGLKTTDLAEGYVLGRYTGHRLSVDSCEYITTEVCENGPFNLCQEWAAVSIERVSSGEKTTSTIQEIRDKMEFAKSKNDFDSLCATAVSDNQGITKPNAVGLKCYMWTNYGHPWLIMQPVPMELVSRFPDVAVFYNVISDEDIEYLKKIATPSLESARIMEMEQSVEVDSYRVAHNCWLSRKNNSVITKLDALVGAITGLQVRGNSEQLQVANYGIGGHYGAHTDPMDFTPEQEMEIQNRKATFMFYLSDVALGGATVFLVPGIAVMPVKGSAVFWHNLLVSGSFDIRTLHGSCPVLIGDKWVANKWIWETKKEMCKPKEYIGRIHWLG